MLGISCNGSLAYVLIALEEEAIGGAEGRARGVGTVGAAKETMHELIRMIKN